MNYLEAKALLGSRTRRKLCNNTYIHWEPIRGNNIYITLHGHTIVRFTPDYHHVSDCGWPTRTTKDRLNRYSDLTIIQDKGVWYCYPKGSKGFYEDFVNGDYPYTTPCQVPYRPWEREE